MCGRRARIPKAPIASGGCGDECNDGAAMSLINQMLRDLDERRAAHGVGANLPSDVRPLPKARKSYWPVSLAVGAGVVIVLGIAGVFLRDDVSRHLAPVGATVTQASAPAAPVGVAPVPAAAGTLTTAALPPVSAAASKPVVRSASTLVPSLLCTVAMALPA